MTDTFDNSSPEFELENPFENLSKINQNQIKISKDSVNMRSVAKSFGLNSNVLFAKMLEILEFV